MRKSGDHPSLRDELAALGGLYLTVLRMMGQRLRHGPQRSVQCEPRWPQRARTPADEAARQKAIR